MDAREQRGLVIAATQKLTKKGKVWLVPSQSGNGTYEVVPGSDQPRCSCPDHGETGGVCKHLYAVRFVMKRETGKDGTVTETREFTFTEKKVYRTQNWPLYNLAQREEKRRFLALLHDLCKGLPNAKQTGAGRRRTAMSDMIFTIVFKIYSSLSARRFGSDLDEAFDKGYLTRKINATLAWTLMENEMLTPVLKQLVSVSAMPLKAVETNFAVDSSGFSTSRFVRWFDEKYGAERSGRDWVKCHVCCGTQTHVITAVEILGRDAADAPLFAPLVKKTAERFKIGEVSADKAYLSAENIETVFQFGGTPFIQFKENSTGGIGGLFQKMFHFYSMNRDEYMDRYHKRSNVESVFSMAKAKFGDSVRSKTDVAMKNEVLCKLLAHNICCLIMSQFELGIDPVFWGKKASEPEVREVVDTEVAPVVRGEMVRMGYACAGA